MDVMGTRLARRPLIACLFALAAAAMIAVIAVVTRKDSGSSAKISQPVPPEALALSADGALLGVTNDLGMELYSLPGYERVAQFPFRMVEYEESIAWNADLSRVATSFGTQVKIYDVRRNLQVRWLPNDAPESIVVEQRGKINVTTPAPEAIVNLAWSPDDRYVAIVRHSGAVDVWDLETNGVRRVQASGNGADRCLAWSPDGAALAFGATLSRELLIYAAPDFTQPRALQLAEICSQAVFHPNGRLLAVNAQWASAIEVWELDELTRVATRQAPATALAWHPSAEALAALTTGRVELWRPADDALAVLPAHGATVNVSVAFSPDGRDLLVGSDDGALRAWPLAERAPALFR
jgi:dipeptidyl aminopeptidase/acylaminoacyl peptidase